MYNVRDYRTDKQPVFDIAEIIEDKSLKVYFQPVISVSRKTTVGVEGLIRGFEKLTGRLIAPKALFDAANKEGVALDLDRACRDKVLDAFSKIYRQSNDKVLFLNIDASILDKASGSNYLLSQVEEKGIDPRNIVIEISETKVKDSAALKRFADTYRRAGFMIALDDVGTGASNMERILLVKPNIIKIDISLVRNICNDYYKQGVFRSLVQLSNKIGALVVAEGVETEEEAIQVLRLGGHMIQGFYFEKPIEFHPEMDMLFDSNNYIGSLSKRFNQYMNRKLEEESKKLRNLNTVVNKLVKKLSGISKKDFDDVMMKAIWAEKIVECAYILDEIGIQISSTVRFYDKNETRKSMLFYAADKGTDHSMERYYYPLVSARLKKYITEPYVSLATGSLCITLSHVFKNVDGRSFILCMDFNVGGEEDTELLGGTKASELALDISGRPESEISKMINRMSEIIIKDSLTDTYNRRYIEERMLEDIYSAANQGIPVSVIMTDIDHFKVVNDTYGHLAGDYVLKEFVRILKSNIADSDLVARYGGEEFLIVLFNADKNDAFEAAERVRQATEKAQINYQNEVIRITASFGISTLFSPNMPYEKLIDEADKNLYKAKNAGRNKTIN